VNNDDGTLQLEIDSPDVNARTQRGVSPDDLHGSKDGIDAVRLDEDPTVQAGRSSNGGRVRMATPPKVNGWIANDSAASLARGPAPTEPTPSQRCGKWGDRLGGAGRA